MRPIRLEADKQTIYSLLLMLLFILAIYVVANFIVLQDLDRNVTLKNRYKIQKTIYGYIAQNKERLQEEMEQYKDIFHYEPTRSTREQVAKLLGEFGQDIKIQEIFRRQEGRVVQQRYAVQMLIDSPKAFYDFIQGLDKEGLVAQVEWPVRFEKKGDKIAVEFFLTLYTPAAKSPSVPKSPEEVAGS